MEKYELLIDKVKSHELLYNYNMPNYRDQIARQEAWDNIGRELKLQGEIAKIAWEKLRRCFTNAINRRRARLKKMGNSSKRLFHPWKYEKKMSFLIPFTEHRKNDAFNTTALLDVKEEMFTGLHNNENSQSLQEEYNEESCDASYELSCEILENSIDIKREISDSPEKETVVNPTAYFDVDELKKNCKSSKDRPANSLKILNCKPIDLIREENFQNNLESKLINNSYSQDNSRTAHSNLKESSQNSKSSVVNSAENQLINDYYDRRDGNFDETDMFFLSMGRMSKKLSERDQAKIKLILSNAVFQAQISQLDVETNMNTQSASSSSLEENNID